MSIIIRQYTPDDLEGMRSIWNCVVGEGNSFPQTEPLSFGQAERFFAEQSYTAVADDCGEVVGLYILHPNNIGRCGHIANASYAVKANARGKGIGELLVKDSLSQGARLSFRVMQFNAVVSSNTRAIQLYTRLGFTQLGTIPGGFRMKNGTYADIVLFYISL